MTSPLLSVIIPSWNRAGWICDAINSALLQGKPGSIEVVVIDDASSDNTAALLQQIYVEHIKAGQLIYRKLEQRKGCGYARNQGVALANGKFLAFLDSDDIWLPGKFAAELDIFTRFPQAQVVISDSLSFAEGKANQQSRFEFNGLKTACNSNECWLDECDWLWTNCENSIATCSMTLRRDLLPLLGLPLFADDLISCEDWELELKLYQYCRVRVKPVLLAHVRSFDDATRVERAAANKPRTLKQTQSLLQNRRTVMERTRLLPHLSKKLHQEFERMRKRTELQLDELASG
ncbi:glycosyltransferase family 2 protein [Thalassomonas viridans]|uniref:Glycosyltransferase family 2 protein n=1 Tax=Thalassomonas viridans TaxID=137584 RepID=A0AAE9Z7N8_9GAMM|nr:glycosyltransferase family A protein [Thalassomonas viridans]WDE08043.1 glycosyltransferase family 2 protein [Thalassomonas viridans]